MEAVGKAELTDSGNGENKSQILTEREDENKKRWNKAS